MCYIPERSANYYKVHMIFQVEFLLIVIENDRLRTTVPHIADIYYKSEIHTTVNLFPGKKKIHIFLGPNIWGLFHVFLCGF